MSSPPSKSPPPPSTPFFVPVDLGHTALLLADCQTQIMARMPRPAKELWLASVKLLLDGFRESIARHRAANEAQGIQGLSLSQGTPLIIHHAFPFGNNSNSFFSPYNKLTSWVKALDAKGFFGQIHRDPLHPSFGIPPELTPLEGFGGPDEIVLSKIQSGSFGSSELLAYLRGRSIKHVVLIGLTTAGAILGGARGGADNDYHVVVPREAVWDDEQDVNDFILNRLLPKFVDVVSIDDVVKLFKGEGN